MTGNAKLFADNTSLFSVVYEENTYAKEEKKKKVNDWAFQWKMSKQAQEVIFSRKSKRSTHSPLVFNNVFQIFSQKHLGVILDFKLTFEEHLNNVLAKVNKAVGISSKLRNILPRTALITIYKAFNRPNLDYGDVLYDQAFNNSFKETLKSIQYNACLALPGAIRGTSKEKIYQELVQKALPFPKYLLRLIPTKRSL